jgi:hypothetical protein
MTADRPLLARLPPIRPPFIKPLLIRSSPVRRAAFCLCLVCPPVHASTILPSDVASYTGTARSVRPPALPPGGVYVSLGEDLRVQGQPMAAWFFDAPGRVGEVAEWLSKGQPALRDMLVVPGSAILSGTDGVRQWAARLSDDGSGRTRGTVSALSLLHRPAASAPLPWTPGGARLHFEIRSRENKQTVIQQIWTHAAAPAPLWRQLQASLQAAGWHETTAADAGARAWSKAAARLSVVVTSTSAGSGVVSVLHLDE